MCILLLISNKLLNFAPFRRLLFLASTPYTIHFTLKWTYN